MVHCALISWATMHSYRTCPNFPPEGCSTHFHIYILYILNISETYFLSYLLNKGVKTVVQPSSFPLNIGCNHRHHLVQPSWRWVVLGRKSGGAMPRTAYNWTLKDLEKNEFGSKRSNAGRAGTQKGRFDVGDEKKYPKKIVFNHQKVKKEGAKRWHICITQHRGSTLPGNALIVDRSCDDDGCSCNHRAVPPVHGAAKRYLFPDEHRKVNSQGSYHTRMLHAKRKTYSICFKYTSNDVSDKEWSLHWRPNHH